LWNPRRKPASSASQHGIALVDASVVYQHSAGMLRI